MLDPPLSVGRIDPSGVRPRVPLVSVGVPTFNRAATLERSLASVLAQDYPAIELVVSDNASTDATEEMCRLFASRDSRVQYLRQTFNRGPTENFMEVLRRSRGEYFMWLGDDDWLPDPSYISTCTLFLLGHRDYALACGVARYFRGGTFLSEGNTIDLPQESPSARLMGYYAAVQDNGAFYGVMRRDQLLRIGMKPVIANDWLLVANVAFLGKVRTLEGIAVNREDNTPERTFERIAAENAQPPIRGRFPYLFIGFSVLRDIAWASPVYSPLSPPRRFALGLRCQALVARRHIWPGVREELKRVAVRLVPGPLQSAVRFVLRRPRRARTSGGQRAPKG